MPSLLSHPALPLTIGLGLGSAIIPPRLLLAGIAASLIPDLDVLGFKFGIAYGSAFGHRGFSHSILFALLLALLAVICAGWIRAPRRRVFSFVFLSCLSHAVLDAFTSGGKGVAFLWPFSEVRYFAPFHPIRVSPFGVERFLSERGVTVIMSELQWIWLPGVCLGMLLFLWRNYAVPVAAEN